ncbi:autophagy-related protein 9 isoform X1 [Amborella trichopoda]|uniref:Autophagy-related protein 9 n=1 Tax=Amborella trichopoda TaxID=13333 RepID=W1PDR0_AMBTC|nr:autophagy-related protein 9 isoform X1 [Amborella trichopoda]XP_020524011.1 autophagy-related protein 9 isoform X1 [Amborella trichopoda]ERN08077.1 hypothetical protein AMTR_s00012p00264860 [Amborella trichopoda]|eukprot:XP_006846402.1 autophagy-related protein 9 isoform X1 [Amborella trichopoda]
MLLGKIRWPWNVYHGDASVTKGLLSDIPPEIELSEYQRLPSGDTENPPGLLNDESLKVETVTDLDLFYSRVYSYYCEKGLWCIVTKWIVEILSLGFMICFSGFFLLFVDWHNLRNAKCGVDAIESGSKPCDLVKEVVHSKPFMPFTLFKGIVAVYLGLFSIYWAFCFLRFFAQLKGTIAVRNFYNNSLNINDREVQTISWSAVLEKVAQVRCPSVVKDLSAHDIVMRIMRRENYLMAMLNKGVLAVPVPYWVPGAGPAINSANGGGRKNRLILTKTLEWCLNWCILQNMFDRNFMIRRDFVNNPFALRKKLMAFGFGMLLVSPFLAIFMLVYCFLRHAEQFYNHPSTASSRRWSNLSKWLLREFNEVDHLFRHRLNTGSVHSVEYLKQFPCPMVSLIAKFISFVAGGFAAVLIIIAFLDESLLEAQLYGRNLLWFAAIFGTITAISRAVIPDELHVFDPEGAMSIVVQHTHYMPKSWRGKENSNHVRSEFEALFQYTGLMLLEDMVSIFLTPYVLFFLLPKKVDGILKFISDFTVDVEGVGHVCSLSVFDFESHGNRKYGSPYHTSKEKRSCQGKMEKSFLSFKNNYPSWEPNARGKQFLSTLQDFQEQVQGHQIPQRFSDNTRSVSLGELHQRLSLSNKAQVGQTWMGPPFMVQNRSDEQLTFKTEQADCPYLLDHYYVSRPLHEARSGDSLCSVGANGAPPSVTPFCESSGKERERDFLKDQRAKSHFDASCSSTAFGEHSLWENKPVEDGKAVTSHWWARPRPRSGSRNSFLEPTSIVSPIVHEPWDDSNHSFGSDEHERFLHTHNSQSSLRKYVDDMRI